MQAVCIEPVYGLLSFSFPQSHFSTCAFNVIPCPNRCSVKLTRRDLPEHLQHDCPKRKVKCEFCGSEFTGEAFEVLTLKQLKTSTCWCLDFGKRAVVMLAFTVKTGNWAYLSLKPFVPVKNVLSAALHPFYFVWCEPICPKSWLWSVLTKGY